MKTRAEWDNGCGRMSKLKLDSGRPGRLAARASGGMSMASFTCSGRGASGVRIAASEGSNGL